MYFYETIIQNKELFKFIYSIIIIVICFIIVLKTDRLFRLSFHQGIRYFRNAFFFYGLAFIARYLLGANYLFAIKNNFQFSVIEIVFEFCLIMAGFSLLYSLVWKKFERPGNESFSSLFNVRFFLFYTLAVIIAILDYLWATYIFLFILQILLFSYASIISCINYKNKRMGGFLKLYFIVMLLNLAAWTANFLASTFFEWHQGVLIGIYLLNIIIFVILLYGVIKTTKNKG